jgi:alcohol dehydrogenase class IV
MARLGRALGIADPAAGLFDLARGLGATMSLKDLGMPDDSVAAAVDQAMSNAYWNPRALEKRALTDLLERAFGGDAPRAA